MTATTIGCWQGSLAIQILSLTAMTASMNDPRGMCFSAVWEPELSEKVISRKRLSYDALRRPRILFGGLSPLQSPPLSTMELVQSNEKVFVTYCFCSIDDRSRSCTKLPKILRNLAHLLSLNFYHIVLPYQRGQSQKIIGWRRSSTTKHLYLGVYTYIHGCQ